MMTKNEKKSGFTLVELMVSAVVGILAVLVLFAISFTIQDNIAITTGVLDISEKGRLAINHVSRDMREARSVISSYGVYSTGDTSVVLEVPSLDGGGDIIDPEMYVDIIVYRLDPGDSTKLQRVVDANNMVSSRADITETVAEDVSALLFSSGGTGLSSVADLSGVSTVTTKITTQSSPLGFSRTNDITTSVSLRNKED